MNGHPVHVSKCGLGGEGILQSVDVISGWSLAGAVSVGVAAAVAFLVTLVLQGARRVAVAGAA